MSEVSNDGQTFNLRFEGDADLPVVALAHQLGGSLAVWEPLMPALLDHFRVLRWDSRGHGASVADPEPYSVAQLARDALAIFDAVGIGQAHWIGLSMGSIVGQAAMIAAPHRIGRAVLANTAARLGTPDLWNARIAAARGEGMESMAGPVAARWFAAAFREAEPEIVEAIMIVLRETPPLGYAAACAALRDADQREAIRAIRNKVLVIAGRHDASAPPELGAFVAEAIEGARLTTLVAAHISHIEQTDAFAAAAIEFLTAPEAPVRQPAPAPRKTTVRRVAPRRAAPVAATKPAAKKPAARPPVAGTPAAGSRAAARRSARAAGRIAAGRAAARLKTAKPAPAATAAPARGAAARAAVRTTPAKIAAPARANGKSAKAAPKLPAARSAKPKAAAKAVVKPSTKAVAARSGPKKSAQKKAAPKKPAPGKAKTPMTPGKSRPRR